MIRQLYNIADISNGTISDYVLCEFNPAVTTNRNSPVGEKSVRLNVCWDRRASA